MAAAHERSDIPAAEIPAAKVTAAEVPAAEVPAAGIAVTGITAGEEGRGASACPSRNPVNRPGPKPKPPQYAGANPALT
ncbi:MAG TPA: hypothetical protein VEH31_36370 [Streptosporangiaceae bacterium]|nr:hypothetical protein [Streptosporangiaceae bacterium]